MGANRSTCNYTGSAVSPKLAHDASSLAVPSVPNVLDAPPSLLLRPDSATSLVILQRFRWVSPVSRSPSSSCDRVRSVHFQAHHSSQAERALAVVKGRISGVDMPLLDLQVRRAPGQWTYHPGGRRAWVNSLIPYIHMCVCYSLLNRYAHCAPHPRGNNLHQ